MRFPVLLWILMTGAALLGGCATTVPPMGEADVVQLCQDGQTSPETLRLLVRHHGVDFPLSPQMITTLREQGMDEEEVQAVLAGAADLRTEERISNSGSPILGLALGLLRAAGGVVAGLL